MTDFDAAHPRSARVSEIPLLLDIQRRASEIWAAYRDDLAAHPEVITLPAAQVTRGDVPGDHGRIGSPARILSGHEPRRQRRARRAVRRAGAHAPGARWTAHRRRASTARAKQARGGSRSPPTPARCRSTSVRASGTPATRRPSSVQLLGTRSNSGVCKQGFFRMAETTLRARDPSDRQDPRSEHRGVARVVDADARHRNAGRHLAIESSASRPPATDVRLVNGTPMTGRSVWAATTPGSAARQAGAGDDHPQAAHARVARVVGDGIGLPVSGHDPDFTADAAVLQFLLGLLHLRQCRSWSPSRCRRAGPRPRRPRTRRRARRDGGGGGRRGAVVGAGGGCSVPLNVSLSDGAHSDVAPQGFPSNSITSAAA